MPEAANTRQRSKDMIGKAIATGFGNAGLTVAGITIFHFWGWYGLLAYIVIQAGIVISLALGALIAHEVISA